MNFIYMYVYHVCSILAESRRGHHSTWILNYWWLVVSHTMWILRNKVRSSLNGSTASLALFSFLLVKKIPFACNELFFNFSCGIKAHYNSLMSTIPTLPSARTKGMLYHAQCNVIVPQVCCASGITTILLQVSVTVHFVCFLKRNIELICVCTHLCIWNSEEIFQE